MTVLLFYLIVALIFIVVILLFVRLGHQRRLLEKPTRGGRQGATADSNLTAPMPYFTMVAEVIENSKVAVDDVVKQSPYDPNLIILRVDAFSGKPYMGYELHQALLSAGLRFGEMNIFHRYEHGDKGNILFSLAAATTSGSFDIENFGSFSCSSLLLFMSLNAKKKLMPRFDLMLDTARQLVEELGGEIYDDLQQLLNVVVIKRLRERICAVETSNLYTSDLLDNLD